LNELQGKIQLDFRSDEPLTLQIVRQIEELVRQGTLKQGDQLPTVRELATELRINFSTVARAYKILDEERMISTQRGRGTYIWEVPDPDTPQKLRQRSLEEMAHHYLAEAARLGCSPAEARKVLDDIVSSE
jgi:GntR family transcriptional regulator